MVLFSTDRVIVIFEFVTKARNSPKYFVLSLDMMQIEDNTQAKAF